MARRIMYEPEITHILTLGTARLTSRVQKRSLFHHIKSDLSNREWPKLSLIANSNNEYLNKNNVRTLLSMTEVRMLLGSLPFRPPLDYL